MCRDAIGQSLNIYNPQTGIYICFRCLINAVRIDLMQMCEFFMFVESIFRPRAIFVGGNLHFTVDHMLLNECDITYENRM